MADTDINDLVNERSVEVVFGTCQIQVTEFSTDRNGTLFFVDRNRIRNPSSIHDGVYETCCGQFLDLGFDHSSLSRVNESLFLGNMYRIRPCVDTLFDDIWINPNHFGIGPSESIMEILKKCFV